MQEAFPERFAPGQTRPESEGDGHADDEEKGREDQIDEGHAAAAVKMPHPRGDNPAIDARDVVDIDHGEYDQAA